MFGRNARLTEEALLRDVRYIRSVLQHLQDRFDHLEKLVNIGTTRLDLHAQRLGALEDDVENLK